MIDPGNVRELENAVKLASSLGTSAYIRPEDLPQDIPAGKPEAGEINLWLRS